MYAIEKSGKAITVTNHWTREFAEKCGLAGNGSPPKNLPYKIKGGGTLRIARVVQAVKSEFQTAKDNPGSLVGDEWVITQTTTDMAPEAVREIQIVRIKAEASQRIEAFAPIWKQINGGERATELIEIKLDRPWTPEEQGEADNLRGARGKIKSIRAKSNSLEELSDPDLLVLNPSDDKNWLLP